MPTLEETARLIASHKMGLVKDLFGDNLPFDLWRQAVPAAGRELGMTLEETNVAFERIKERIAKEGDDVVARDWRDRLADYRDGRRALGSESHSGR